MSVSRDNVLTLVRAFPGSPVSRICAFLDGAQPYLRTLEREGLIRLDRAETRGRPAMCAWPVDAPRPGPSVPVSPALSDDHRAAQTRVGLWIGRLVNERDGRGVTAARKRHLQGALDMLVEMHTRPHLYGRERPMREMLTDMGAGDGREWPAAARILSDMGAIDLFIRKGVGRETGLRLKVVPPYPLG